jgi:hypothetical protein
VAFFFLHGIRMASLILDSSYRYRVGDSARVSVEKAAEAQSEGPGQGGTAGVRRQLTAPRKAVGGATPRRPAAGRPQACSTPGRRRRRGGRLQHAGGRAGGGEPAAGGQAGRRRWTSGQLHCCSTPAQAQHACRYTVYTSLTLLFSVDLLLNFKLCNCSKID